MSVVLFVVTLVIGILVVLALVAVPFIVVFRRRYLAAGERLNSELELEGTLIPPGKGVTSDNAAWLAALASDR